MRTSSSLIAASALAFSGAVSAQVQSNVANLVSSLRVAPTQDDRIALLNDMQYTFDFLNPPSGVTTGAGGHTVAASSENFPAVVGNGVSMTIGFLGPCGMNTPHTHPRATEINFSLNTTLRAGFLAENGARFAMIDIAPGSATVFPQGAIHFEMNPSCQPAMFVAGFNGEDPGVQQQAQRFFGLPPDIVGAALNGLGVEEVFGLESLIPDNVALGTAECLQRCGIAAPAVQPTSQRQPRVAANAFPASLTGETIVSSSASSAAAVSEATSSVVTKPSSSPVSLIAPGASLATEAVSKDNTVVNAVQPTSTSAFDWDSNLKPLLVALVGINAVILLGIIVGLIIFLKTRGKKDYTQAKYVLPRGMLLNPDHYRAASPYGSSYPSTPEAGYLSK